MFLFPVSAFITWKWLLWKILIKHRLFPGWTETECYSYSIAWHFALLQTAVKSVCVCVCVCVSACMYACGLGRGAGSGCCSLCFTLQRSQQRFSGVGGMADPFVWSRFFPASSPSSWTSSGCACKAPECGWEEGGRHMCV